MNTELRQSGLLISFGYTCHELIKCGKTVTRRDWKPAHAAKFIKAFQQGLLIRAFDKDQRYQGKQIGWLELTCAPYQETLQKMPVSDVALEGFPKLTKKAFLERFFKKHDRTKPVWVVRFKFQPLISETLDTQPVTDSVETATVPVDYVRSILKDAHWDWDLFSPEMKQVLIKILGVRTEKKALERIRIIEGINERLPEASRCKYSPIQEDWVVGLPCATSMIKVIKKGVEPNFADVELLAFYRECWQRFEKWEKTQPKTSVVANPDEVKLMGSILPEAPEVLQDITLATPPTFASRPKPVLPKNAPTLVTTHTCGGLFVAGAIAAGFKPILGVEFYPGDDRVRQRQSAAAADNYELNFGKHLVRKTVEQCVEEGLFKNYKPDAYQCSPSCTNFRAGKEEDEFDLSSAQAVCDAIAQLGFPKLFILENVALYRRSESWQLIIRNFLYLHGYGVSEEVIIASNYGVPQDRKRFIVRAVKGQFPPSLPRHVENKMGCSEAIEDLIEGLPDGELAPFQLARLPEKITSSLLFAGGNKALPQPADVPSFTITGDAKWASILLVERYGASNGYLKICKANEPCWTINGAATTDQNGSSRSEPINLIVDGQVKKLTARAIARLQSVPDWYELPQEMKFAGPLLGNGVPSLLAEIIMQDLLRYL